jgi:phage/plasmid-like protein (TIGR03299 family)
MSHEFETGFVVRTPAWHRLGVVLPEAPSVGEAIRLAGLDWSVSLQPLAALLSEAGGEEMYHAREVSTHRAVLRDSDGAVLGVVGKDFRPLQNARAFEFFEPFVSSGACQLETAGALKGGKRVWVLAKLRGAEAEVVPTDSVRGFFLLSNAHDGSQAVRAQFTTIRVVCWNTLNRADRRADSGLEDCLRVRHTPKVEHGLDLVQRTVDMAAETFRATVADFQRMASRGLPVDGLGKYVCEVLEVTEEERQRGIGRKAWEAVRLAYFNAPGASIADVRGTYWGAYNALTDWVDHTRGNRGEAARLESAWFGEGARLKQRAYDVALAA